MKSTLIALVGVLIAVFAAAPAQAAHRHSHWVHHHLHHHAARLHMQGHGSAQARVHDRRHLHAWRHWRAYAWREGRRPRRAAAFDCSGAGGVRALIARHAAENGVPFRVADAVVRIESGYRPRVAHGGALGLMQIKPQTARGLGFSGPASALMLADVNLHFGMRYLALAWRLSGGDLCATVMRYQSGAFASRMNAANRAYCSRARAIIANG